MYASVRLVVVVASSFLMTATLLGQRESCMRGFSGSRVAANADEVPIRWNDDLNIKWKVRLPGPGASSPIVVNDQVLVTCYSGYGVEAKRPGQLKNLKRHLMSFDRRTGKQIWHKLVRNGDKEDALTRQISDHGYASSTPIADDKHIYAFFGKAGVVAYDLQGQSVWKSDIGSGSSRFQQGSGSSPTLFGELLIINASDESNSIVALNRNDGQPVWQREAKELDGSYVTPRLLPTAGDRQQLVVAMINQAWGLDPRDGKQLWKLATQQGGSLVPTPVATEYGICLFGGMGGTTYCIDHELSGEIGDANIKWKSRDGSIVPSPLFHNGHLYWADMSGIAFCVDARNGKRVYKKRLGKRAGCYASPVLLGDNILYTTRTAGVYVVAAKPAFQVLAHNRLQSDSSRFDGTPAVIDDCLYLRSNQALYCIGK